MTYKWLLLPPASEGWREVIFSVCPHFGGVPNPALDGGGGTRSSLGRGGTPTLDGGGTPSHVRGGTPSWGHTPSHVWWGIPGTPPHHQNSKHLLRLCGGRCASCVHAGGLSCSYFVLRNRFWVLWSSQRTVFRKTWTLYVIFNIA